MLKVEREDCTKAALTLSVTLYVASSVSPWPITRMTAPNNGEEIFSSASFGISGASAKNESPLPSLTERMMLSAQGLTAPLKRT